MDGFDHETAAREGWGLMETCGTADAGTLRIERIDVPDDGTEPVFSGDDEAWRHVMARAVAGSAMHRQAIAAVAADNPTELAFAQGLSPSLMRLLGHG